jgi:hypothetical protein
VQPQVKTRLLVALLCYAGLAVLAGLTLQNFDKYPIRTAVWVLLGALAVKTWIAAARRE